MKRELNYQDYANKLVDEYRESYEKIHIYIKSSLFTGVEIIPVMDEIVDLLLSAQADERPIEAVIGKNLEKFCASIVKSNKKPLEGMVLRLCTLVFLCAVVAIFQIGMLLFDAINGQVNAWMHAVDISGFVVGLVVAFLVSFAMDIVSRALVFRIKKLNSKLYKRFFRIAVIVEFLIIVILIGFADISIEIPRTILIAICLVYAIVVTVFTRLYIKKHKNDSSDDIIPVKIAIKDDIQNQIIDRLRKRYLKIVAKQQRKGKTILSANEWFKKDTKTYKISMLVAATILLFVVCGFIILVATSSTAIDTIIFAAIIVILEFPIFWVFYKGARSRLNLAAEIVEKNTDIFDDSLKSNIM